ncbi:MAG: cellobiose phosphorylase, partial [Roseburia sp.]|nr:cellobiose phosphorylase [Roseburia sp.]
ITRVWMDHGFWPFLTTKLYIDQTGDWQILLEKQNYFKDKQVCRGTGTDEKWKPEDGTLQRDSEKRVAEGTILEHLLLQNLTAFYETGEHNHFRLRGADWNDALDMAEERGESVAFTAAYSGNLKALAELLRYLDKNGVENITLAEEITLLLQQEPSIYSDSKEKNQILQRYMESCIHEVSGRKTEVSCRKAADTLDTMAEWIWKHIRKTEWVGDDNGRHWFNSYYDNHGNKAEGVQEGSVRMMLTGQVFTIMSGTATEEQTAEITKAADTYLYKKDAGGYRLNTDFGELKTDLGRMFGFAYGQKENGAVFSHMTVMYGNALYQRGFVREGYKALHTLYEQSADFEHSRIYPGIPEYFNAKGRGMYHYLTGAASWLMLTVVQQMFGVRGELGNLLLDPKLLASQFDTNGRAEISITFAGRNFHIVYENTSRKDYGEYHIAQVLLNGASQDALIKRELILSLPEEKTNEIKVILK